MTVGSARPCLANAVSIAHRFGVPFARLPSSSSTTRTAAYADGMSGNCDTSYHNTPSGGYYLPDDEPFMMYADVVNDASRCAAHNQPLTRLSTDLQSTATQVAELARNWFVTYLGLQSNAPPPA